MSEMPSELVITSMSSPDARLRLSAAPGEELDVDLEVRGMTARTRVDARMSATMGWEHPDPGVVLDSTQRGLVELLDYVAAHADGWPDEERWQSRDAKLQLGFSSLGGEVVLVSIVLKQYVPEGWVAYAKFRLAASTLNSICKDARRLFAVESA